MISLVLQAYPGDLAAVFELASLICDIQPEKLAKGEFYLVYRQDCDPRTEQHWHALVSQKFGTARACAARNFDTGWPGGSNMLAACAFMEVSILCRQGVFKNNGFLLFEHDCVPMRADWLEILSWEWDRAYASGRQCMGHWHQIADRSTLHMNGNAVFSADFFDRRGMQGLLGPATQGWDYWHREHFIAVGTDTNLIYQWYNCASISCENLAGITKGGIRPALFHGVKDGSARACIRESLCGGIVQPTT